MEGETTASFKVIFAPNLSLPARSGGGGRMSICINRNLACYGVTTTKVQRPVADGGAAFRLPASSQSVNNRKSENDLWGDIPG